MEFFTKPKAVRLKSHINKYLIADDDKISTRQSSRGDTKKSRWTVEHVDNNRRVVRLKSYYNRYLTASNVPYILGTGQKVVQTLAKNHTRDSAIEWEPIRDGFQVKLKAFDGTYLKANGGTPPWRNSVTHDKPNSGATRDWVIWDVEAVEVPEDEEIVDYFVMVSSFSSISSVISGLEFDCGSPSSLRSSFTGPISSTPRTSLISIGTTRTTAMDLFFHAKSVRLKNCHDKFLTADEDEESVTQSRDGSSKAAKWTVEYVATSDNIIRLKSCYGKYLTASNMPFLLGMTGRKVLQTLPKRLDSSVEWEPVRERGAVKLKTRYGQFLRANGGLPPWRNSVTHDIPHRTSTKEWILWEVHMTEIMSPAVKPAPPLVVGNADSFSSEYNSPVTSLSSMSRQESNNSLVTSPPRGSDGRLIYFYLADENGEIDEGFEELCITFKGYGVDELRTRLEDELGIGGISVCGRLNGKLYPLHLQLPPNNASMHVVVVPPSSQGISSY